MKQIIITAITERGRIALKEHIATSPKFKVWMLRKAGVTQQLDGDKLVISMNGKSLQQMEYYFPEKLDKYLLEEKSKITKELDKMDTIEDIDYNITIK